MECIQVLLPNTSTARSHHMLGRPHVIDDLSDSDTLPQISKPQGPGFAGVG